MNETYQPKPEHKFTFGLWTLGNRGRDPFGDAVRPTFPPNDIASVLGEIGAWGVNLHDNDLVPIDATAAERDRIVREFRKACQQAGIVVPMRCRRRCARWTWEPNSARRSLFYGEAAKASRPTPADAPTKPSSACARPSTIFANTTLRAGISIVLPWKPSPTSLEAIFTWPPPVIILDSFPRSIIPKW